MPGFPDILPLGQLDQLAPFLCFAVLMVLGAFSLLFIFPAIHVLSEKRNIRSVFRELANSMQGSFYGAGILHMPQVVFEKKGTLFRVRLDRSATNKRRLTLVVAANWENRGFRLRLTPEDFGSRYAHFAGIGETRIGDPEFDERFLIQTNDEDVLRGMLDKKVRKLLLRSGPYQDFDLQILAGTITWRRQFETGSAENLRQQIHGFTRLYDAMASAALVGFQATPLTSAEIRFLGTEQASTPGNPPRPSGVFETTHPVDDARIPICLFCGTEIVERIVHCKSCDTAHHRECWKEVGSCTIYGCGEKKFRSPNKRRRRSRSKKKSRYRIMD